MALVFHSFSCISCFDVKVLSFLKLREPIFRIFYFTFIFKAQCVFRTVNLSEKNQIIIVHIHRKSSKKNYLNLTHKLIPQESNPMDFVIPLVSWYRIIDLFFANKTENQLNKNPDLTMGRNIF